MEALRRPRDEENQWLVVSAADPLNLVGIVSPGARVPATRGNRLVFHNGQLIATLQSGDVHFLKTFPEKIQEKLSRALKFQLVPLREALLKELAETLPIS